jgi:hypothetical protein
MEEDKKQQQIIQVKKTQGVFKTNLASPLPPPNTSAYFLI